MFLLAIRVITSPYNSTPGYISEKKKKKKTENTNSKRYLLPKVHSSITDNCQGTEATQVSINRRMDREGVYIYSGILLSHKKGNVSICSNMDGLQGHHVK